VDRYIPGYVFFGDISPEHTSIDAPRWLGKGLAVVIDDQRRFLWAVEF
jgi:D-glycerate 3-kinase